MKCRQNLHYLLAGFLLLACLTLAACSTPDSSTILRKAEKTKISNFQLQVDDHYYDKTGRRLRSTARSAAEAAFRYINLTQTGDRTSDVGRQPLCLRKPIRTNTSLVQAKANQYTTPASSRRSSTIWIS